MMFLGHRAIPLGLATAMLKKARKKITEGNPLSPILQVRNSAADLPFGA
jgi:hypothetical protein